MKTTQYRNFLALITAILFACSCLAAFAEETAAAEEAEVNEIINEEGISHALWGFFIGWAEDDTRRMLDLCSAEWKHGKADPGQDLLKILGPAKPRGYRINSISANGDGTYWSVSVTVQRETENGEFTYSTYEILCRNDVETDMYVGFNPDGFGAGVSAEPVPEEEMVMLTAEGMIRNAMELNTEKGLYERMIPVNTATEKQGIRFEVVAGLAIEHEEWFVVSVEDTEGRYSGAEMWPSFESMSDGTDILSCQWSRVYCEGNKAIYVVRRETKQPAQSGSGDITVSIPDIWIRQAGTVSLRPMLDQYGRKEEGVPHPALEGFSSRSGTPAVPEDLKVLDYKTPMDLPLYGDLCLGGIAWIGDQLHVQLHYLGTEYTEMANGRGNTCSTWVNLAVYGKPYGETEADYSPLYWDGNNNGWSEWTEYVFNCKPEEAEQIVISADITLKTAILEGGWDLSIPRDAILVPSGT